MTRIKWITPERKYKPSPDINRAAVVLAGKLRKVTHPTRGWKNIQSEVPPGRLLTSQALQRKAQIANGERVTAKPFEYRKRARVEHTPITCGIMFDGSGSQSDVQETVGVARYVLTEALARVQGRVAAVRFGVQAQPIQAPHEPLREIEIYEAFDAWENYIEGFSLLDEALNLIDGHGARLLFIVTDGNFNDQRAVEYAEITMDMCRQNGVAVIWLDCGGRFVRPDAFGHGTVINIRDMSPIAVANLLGDAIVDEFRRSAPQHSLLAA
jgi:hypothetical protein